MYTVKTRESLHFDIHLLPLTSGESVPFQLFMAFMEVIFENGSHSDINSYTHTLRLHKDDSMTYSNSWRCALFANEHYVRLVLLAFLLKWRDQLPVGGMTDIF